MEDYYCSVNGLYPDREIYRKEQPTLAGLSGIIARDVLSVY